MGAGDLLPSDPRCRPSRSLATVRMTPLLLQPSRSLSFLLTRTIAKPGALRPLAISALWPTRSAPPRSRWQAPPARSFWTANPEMWHRHREKGNSELIAELQRNGYLKSQEGAAAMMEIDRAHFVPTGGFPYEDSPQSIGHGATISAPHMHAYCLTSLANHLKPGMRVLDVGSGSGYLTAIFATMVGENGKVVGIEYIPDLVETSLKAIRRGPARTWLENGVMEIHVGDGKQGWSKEGPFDAIHVGAAAAQIPQALVDQLKRGGRMVIPVGEFLQDFVVIDKGEDGSIKETRDMESVTSLSCEK